MLNISPITCLGYFLLLFVISSISNGDVGRKEWHNWQFAFAKRRDVEFPRQKVYGWQNSIVGSDQIQGRLVNSRAPEIVIYLRTYLCTHLCAASHTATRALLLSQMASEAICLKFVKIDVKRWQCTDHNNMKCNIWLWMLLASQAKFDLLWHRWSTLISDSQVVWKRCTVLNQPKFWRHTYSLRITCKSSLPQWPVLSGFSRQTHLAIIIDNEVKEWKTLSRQTEFYQVPIELPLPPGAVTDHLHL